VEKQVFPIWPFLRQSPVFFVVALCSCFVLRAHALCSKSHILVTNSLLHAHALCLVLDRARQKDPNMTTGNTGSERERARLGKSSPCACFVLMLRAGWAVTKKPDKHEAESMKHGAQSMSTKNEAQNISMKQRQKNWALLSGNF
jgi:hypothetical protein